MTKDEVDQLILSMYKDYDWSLIPSHMWPGLKEWIEFGIPQGSFLQSILNHDFYEAIFRADNMNQACIVGWAQFLCWHLPFDAHGSLENVKRWRDKGGLRGILSDDVEAA